MSRRPAKTTQADMARAIRAAKQAGATGVEVRPDGTIYIRLTDGEASTAREVTVDTGKEIVL